MNWFSPPHESRRAATASQHGRRRRLTVEPLEDRIAPSIAPSDDPTFHMPECEKYDGPVPTQVEQITSPLTQNTPETNVWIDTPTTYHLEPGDDAIAMLHVQPGDSLTGNGEIDGPVINDGLVSP